MKISELKIPFVWLDMDGVLADWYAGLAIYENVPIEEILKRPHGSIETHNSVTKLVAEGYSETLFATLPELPSGKMLLRYLNINNIKFGILSKPFFGDGLEGSVKGKKIWLEKHNLTNIPWEFRSNKEVFALKGGKQNILIDDLDKNIINWNAAGGIGILFNSQDATPTINKLKEIYAY